MTYLLLAGYAIRAFKDWIAESSLSERIVVSVLLFVGAMMIMLTHKISVLHRNRIRTRSSQGRKK